MAANRKASVRPPTFEGFKELVSDDVKKFRFEGGAQLVSRLTTLVEILSGNGFPKFMLVSQWKYLAVLVLIQEKYAEQMKAEEVLQFAELMQTMRQKGVAVPEFKNEHERDGDLEQVYKLWRCAAVIDKWG